MQQTEASLAERFRGGRFTLTAELDPPRAPDLSIIVEHAKRLQPHVHALNVTDGSRARVRMAGLFASVALRERLGIEVVAHLTTRDRNRIALQADLLGASAGGLRAVLVVTGDSPADGDEPEAKAVSDVDAAGIARLVSALNSGRTLSGKRLDGATNLLVGGGTAPNADDLDKEVAKLRSRVEAGVRFCQTQPVYDVERALRFHELVRPLGIPILYGLLPLQSLESAMRFSRIPGMHVPDTVLRRLETGGEREGLAIAIETARALAPHAAGLHLFPMGRLETVAAIADAVAPWRVD